MTIRIPAALAAAVLLAVPALAADAVPDMKGTWTGRTFSIIAGQGGHWPDNKGTYEHPALHEADLQLVITGQEGRRFWGYSSIAFNGKKTNEPFLGELHGRDNRQVMVADTDGYFTGEIDGDTFSFCYAQAGIVAKTAVVSCTEVKRSR